MWKKSNDDNTENRVQNENIDCHTFQKVVYFKIEKNKPPWQIHKSHLRNGKVLKRCWYIGRYILKLTDTSTPTHSEWQISGKQMRTMQCNAMQYKQANNNGRAYIFELKWRQIADLPRKNFNSFTCCVRFNHFYFVFRWMVNFLSFWFAPNFCLIFQWMNIYTKKATKYFEIRVTLW